MKQDNVKAINKQMKLLAKEVEGILDIGERANARAKYIELLFNISISGALDNGGSCSCGGNCSCGKDAIKEDIPKALEESTLGKEEESVEEPMVDATEREIEEKAEEEMPAETEDEPVEESFKEAADPLEDGEIVEDTVVDDRITVELESGEVVDVTDIYNQITEPEDPDEKLEIAGYIYEYDNCVEEYNSLDNLSPDGSRIYLAWCIKFYPELVNECVSKLTEGAFDNIFDYVNNNNVEGFTQYLDKELESKMTD